MLSLAMAHLRARCAMIKCRTLVTRYLEVGSKYMCFLPSSSPLRVPYHATPELLSHT